ncbi:Regulatory protein SoxS [Candidatus Terasakiella magnetica]|uniref:Regulatory protein SoxS n=2 Tax=Candidatus Terasakiella magnetica TaxID=1867952 RepID=A0A1C3RJJ8_9PROT|nr:Regulatory protein SoxS [Candidatus Terasakiella magnetica]
MKKIIVRFALIFALWAVITPAKADSLIFVHSPGCMYCEMWRDDILPMYHKTTEGQRLPLRQVNLDKGMPKDLKHLIYPTFTPTFIIVNRQMQESGRILGYNEEFFWGFLQEAIKKLDRQKTTS